MGKPLAIVAGAGPGLGQTLVSSFGQSGFTAFGLNRTIPSGSDQILQVDLADPKHTRAKLRNIICTHGAPKLVVHNTAKLVIAPFEETSIEDFDATWRAMVLSTVNLAKGVLPAMVDTGGGTSSSLVPRLACAVVRTFRLLLRPRQVCGH